ncbi:recombination regulator RecX [Rummeliibacillus sp. G93]|uniref:recombination regulator RecX n=1 Tax=Rummeliibacillus TaxID=648802 RepID=UPI001171A92C|nr:MULTISPECIES: recombination regulator RecX [Rummeliibacillus]MBB5170883.1 regulatory protein [Rummeliibacillus stabekisii]UQW96824.1 recombination regulator RecX [Rummeliibacillus sp. G93]GEL05860.1 regulatory protein RecX [Rummeliibacillus stabekisii]
MSRVITKISAQKRNQERYNIFLNEEYAFSVDEGILIQYGLTKGKVLDSLTVEEIAFDDEIQRAFNRSLSYLSYQMRSEHEVRQKLKGLEFGDAVIQEALQKLKKLGFLNDESYSRALVETKKKTAKKGPRAIKMDLKKRGIEENLQQRVLDEFSEDEQAKIAKQLAEKVVRSEHRKTPVQIKQKIQDLLLRKGYSYSICERVIEQVDLSKEDEEWQDMIELQGEKAWKKYASKYTGYELHMRVKQALYQKGFPAEVIDDFIEQKEKEQDNGEEI